MDEEHEELVNVGAVIRDRWKVVKKLGEGGFGAVFECYDQELREACALKVEGAQEQHQVLKMEVAVLKKMQGKSHATKFLGCGRNEKFNYVVMGLLGKNLGDLKRDLPDEKYTVGTGIRLSYQCTRAIEDLHTAGFLHRDLKPGNYAMGRGDLGRTVFILDFGLARQYVNSRGEMRTPRAAAGFRGTVRYAPVAAHRNREMGRGEDIWCILYMTVEFLKGELPWRKLTDKDQVGNMKEKIPPQQLCAGCPEELIAIYKHLLPLKYSDKPDYPLLFKLLNQILVKNRVKMTDPFDWETGRTVARQGPAQPKSGRDRFNVQGEEDEPIDDAFDTGAPPPGGGRGRGRGGGRGW